MILTFENIVIYFSIFENNWTNKYKIDFIISKSPSNIVIPTPICKQPTKAI